MNLCEGQMTMLGVTLKRLSTAFETGSLIGLKLTSSARPSGQGAPREVLWSASPVLGLQMHAGIPSFYAGAGDQIQALMLVRQTLYELCHLPRLSWLFENRKTCWFLRVIGISLNIPNGCFPVSKANFVPWFCFVSWGGIVCFESGSFAIS